MFDIAATAAGGYLVSRMLGVPLVVGIPATFLAGHATHKLMGVKTAFS